MNAKPEQAVGTVHLPVVRAERSGGLVIAPQNMGEALEFAQVMSRSDFVPKHCQGKPGNCLVVAMQAWRWEMDPISVAQKTYFVREGAPPGYEAQLVSAVVHARAPLEGRLQVRWEGAGEALECIVSGKFRGDERVKERRVGIKNITTRNSPLWKTDPQQQLAYYTTRAWARLYCPDVLMGVYTPEEVREGTWGPDAAVDVTPGRSDPAKPKGGKLDRIAEQIAVEHVVDAAAGEARIVEEPVETGGVSFADLETEVTAIPVPDGADGNPDWKAWATEVAKHLTPTRDPPPAASYVAAWIVAHKATLGYLKQANGQSHASLMKWISDRYPEIGNPDPAHDPFGGQIE